MAAIPHVVNANVGDHMRLLSGKASVRRNPTAMSMKPVTYSPVIFLSSVSDSIIIRPQQNPIIVWAIDGNVLNSPSGSIGLLAYK